MTSQPSLPSGAWFKLDFTYDSQGRRIQKVVSAWTGSAYTPQSTNLFLYDGWNLIAELRTPNSPLRTYLWGSDLSGSMQGAGGVGGLLAVNDSAQGAHFAAFDGNGNVVALVSAGDGTTSAQYEFGPFGEVLRATGPMAKANPFRFSTKYQDDETDLLYYGYRYYTASTGRWICRDPNQDLGFRKQFYVKAFGTMKPSKTHARTADANSLFCANTPLNTFDIVGLCTPGDMNAACVVRVVPSGMDVNVKQTLAGLAALASETELFGMVYESGLTAASTFTSLEEAVATGVGGVANTGSTAFATELQKVAAELMKAVGDEFTGWTAWTRLQPAVCTCRWKINPKRWLGDIGHWEDAEPTHWNPVRRNTDLAGDAFDSVQSALKAGASKCQKQLNDWNTIVSYGSQGSVTTTITGD